jgi:hypothetical protein
MASYLRNDNDADIISHNNTPRWAENSEDDWESIPPSDCTYWNFLQFEFDLWQLDLLVSKCGLHSNDQGKPGTPKLV